METEFEMMNWGNECDESRGKNKMTMDRPCSRTRPDKADYKSDGGTISGISRKITTDRRTL